MGPDGQEGDDLVPGLQGRMPVFVHQVSRGDAVRGTHDANPTGRGAIPLQLLAWSRSMDRVKVRATAHSL